MKKMVTIISVVLMAIAFFPSTVDAESACEMHYYMESSSLGTSIGYTDDGDDSTHKITNCVIRYCYYCGAQAAIEVSFGRQSHSNAFTDNGHQPNNTHKGTFRCTKCGRTKVSTWSCSGKPCVLPL